METESFPGVKRTGRGVDHPPPSSAEVEETVEVSIPVLPLSAFTACWRVNFALNLSFVCNNFVIETLN